MKKIIMTFCAAAFSVAVFGQQQDSTNSAEYKTDLQFQNPALGQPKDSQSVYTPQYAPQQQQTSPIIQQRFQTSPSLQYPKLPSQPGLRLQPLQTNPQIPSQTQPLDLNSNKNTNQLNQRVQPSSSETGLQRPG
jgi:hypothetical protein